MRKYKIGQKAHLDKSIDMPEYMREILRPIDYIVTIIPVCVGKEITPRTINIVQN